MKMNKINYGNFTYLNLLYNYIDLNFLIFYKVKYIEV